MWPQLGRLPGAGVWLDPGLHKACALAARSCKRPVPRCCAAAEASPCESRDLYGPFAARRQVAALPRRQEPCRRCGGRQRVRCPQCNGAGHLSRGGYHKRNPVNASRVVGSKWTARRRTLGWRHFHVSQKRVQSNGEKYCLLVSTCDAGTQLWVPLATLKSREAWAAGWLQKCELEAFVGPPCPACSEAGSVPCNLCSRAGQEIEF